MDGSSRAVGSGVPFEWNGTIYVLPPLTVEDYGVLEQFILEHRLEPVDAVLPAYEKLRKNGSLEAAEFLMREAYQDLRKDKTLNKVSWPQFMQFLSTREGMRLGLSLQMKRVLGRAVTNQELDEIVKQVGEQVMARKQAQASAFDELAKLIGHGTTTSPQPAAEKEKNGAPPSPGDASSGSSLTDTTGLQVSLGG